MNTKAVRWASIVFCGIVLAALGPAVSIKGQNAGTDQVPTASFLPERNSMTGTIIYRSATMLVRTRDDVFATIHTSGLIPGNVYTGWFVIFNKPQACATSPCTPADLSNPAVQGALINFGGRIVGLDGVASFAEIRGVGDLTNAHLSAPALASSPGLVDPRRAEIHLAVRNHGPASGDPATLALQLTTFNGGCPPNSCATVQAAPHQP
jgi:hypothetical protein